MSKRIRWDIDRDVIRSRQFDFGKKFLPDGLSKVEQLPFLNVAEKRLFSQLQGRTYANIFGLVERYIGAKILEISRGHWLGDQVALEALVRFTDEELKHQEMFRRMETMIAPGMPPGYRFLPQPNDVARAVLAASTWAVLALTCDIELFTQVHYRSSIDPDTQLDPLWKDVFLFHWKEESQHAILDEMEGLREDERLDAMQRDKAVDDLIGLVGAVDGIIQMRASMPRSHRSSELFTDALRRHHRASGSALTSPWSGPIRADGEAHQGPLIAQRDARRGGLSGELTITARGCPSRFAAESGRLAARRGR